MRTRTTTRRSCPGPRPLLLEWLEPRVVPSFAAPVIFDTGRAPLAVAAGDVNNDGRPDLATANRPGNTVSVLLGNGDGSFQAPRPFPVGTTPYSVTMGE